MASEAVRGPGGAREPARAIVIEGASLTRAAAPTYAQVAAAAAAVPSPRPQSPEEVEDLLDHVVRCAIASASEVLQDVAGIRGSRRQRHAVISEKSAITLAECHEVEETLTQRQLDHVSRIMRFFDAEGERLTQLQRKAFVAVARCVLVKGVAEHIRP